MFWLLCLWQTNPWGPGPVFFIVLSFFILLFNWRKDSISQLRPPGIYELFLRNVLQKLTQGTSKESQLQEGSCPIWLWWSRAAFTGSMSWPHRATAVLQLTGPLTCMWLMPDQSWSGSQCGLCLYLFIAIQAGHETLTSIHVEPLIFLAWLFGQPLWGHMMSVASNLDLKDSLLWDDATVALT